MGSRDSEKTAAMRQKLREDLKRRRGEFKERYGEVLERLRGLSAEELVAITPDPTAPEALQQLIGAVEKATRENLAQAALKERIQALGKVAMRIAKGMKELKDIVA